MAADQAPSTPFHDLLIIRVVAEPEKNEPTPTGDDDSNGVSSDSNGPTNGYLTAVAENCGRWFGSQELRKHMLCQCDSPVSIIYTTPRKLPSVKGGRQRLSTLFMRTVHDAVTPEQCVLGPRDPSKAMGLHSQTPNSRFTTFSSVIVVRGRKGDLIFLLIASSLGIATFVYLFGNEGFANHLYYGRQEDAHEFFRHLLDAMQRDAGCCQRGSSKIISQIFEGSLRSQVKCLTCQSELNQCQPMMDILLDMQNASEIKHCLQEFVKQEYLDGDNSYFCTRCKTMRAASMATAIAQPPNILTLTMKRFCPLTGRKITKAVPFTEKLNLRPYMVQSKGPDINYCLYAVLVHDGVNCNKGHYFSFVKASNGSWYKMNDSVVSPVNLCDVLRQQAYLLFYVRSDGFKQNLVEDDVGRAQESSCCVKHPKWSSQESTCQEQELQERGRKSNSNECDEDLWEEYPNTKRRIQKEEMTHCEELRCKRSLKRKRTYENEKEEFVRQYKRQRV